MPFYYFKPTSGPDLQIKAGWAIVHVCWKWGWLYSIGQANQNVVLSTASMSMLLQGGFRVCPSQKNYKNYMLCIESKGISNILLYIGQWGNSYINCTHISYSYVLI